MLPKQGLWSPARQFKNLDNVVSTVNREACLETRTFLIKTGSLISSQALTIHSTVRSRRVPSVVSSLKVVHSNQNRECRQLAKFVSELRPIVFTCVTREQLVQ